MNGKKMDTESFHILGHSFQILSALSDEIFLIGGKKGPGPRGDVWNICVRYLTLVITI